MAKKRMNLTGKRVDGREAAGSLPYRANAIRRQIVPASLRKDFSGLARRQMRRLQFSSARKDGHSVHSLLNPTRCRAREGPDATPALMLWAALTVQAKHL